MHLLDHRSPGLVPKVPILADMCAVNALCVQTESPGTCIEFNDGVHERADVVRDDHEQGFIRLRLHVLLRSVSVKTRFIMENVDSTLLRRW